MLKNIKNQKKSVCRHYGKGHIARLKSRFKSGKVSKTEIIELLLSYVIRGKDVKQQAKDICSRSGGSFKRVFQTVENRKIEGAGTETRMFFSLLREFISIYYQDKFAGNKFCIKAQEDVVEYFRHASRGSHREAVYALFLDAKNRIIGNRIIGTGTLTQSLLYPREIIKDALSAGALSVIVVHNHPSGETSPSESDRKITKKLIFAMKEMDIVLLDHIIVGEEGRGYYSFYEEGLIDRYNNDYKHLSEAL